MIPCGAEVYHTAVATPICRVIGRRIMAVRSSANAKPLHTSSLTNTEELMKTSAEFMDGIEERMSQEELKPSMEHELPHYANCDDSKGADSETDAHFYPPAGGS